jgi:hypothetical protein
LPQHNGRGGRSSGRRRRKRHKAPATEQSTTMRLAVTLASNAALPKPGATTPCVPAAPARSTSGAAAGTEFCGCGYSLESPKPKCDNSCASGWVARNGPQKWSQMVTDFQKHDPVILPSTMEKSLGRFTSLLESALNPFV